MNEPPAKRKGPQTAELVLATLRQKAIEVLEYLRQMRTVRSASRRLSEEAQLVVGSSTITTQDMENFDQRLLACWNDKREDEFFALCASDVIISDPRFREPIQGKDAARQFMRDFVSAFPDTELRQVNRVITDEAIAAEVEITARSDGSRSMSMPGSEVEANGASARSASGTRIAYFARAHEARSEEGEVAGDNRTVDTVSTFPDLRLSELRVYAGAGGLTPAADE